MLIYKNNHSTFAFKDINEVLTSLCSLQISDRRDGLIKLKEMMFNNRKFCKQEIKRLCGQFTRLLEEPHVQVI